MIKHLDVVQLGNGDAVVGATVTVTFYPSGTATIYSDNGITPVPNQQLTTDAYGTYFYYAPSGHYVETVTVNGVVIKTNTDLFLGSDVVISVTAPTTGQVLTATSATAANWQTLAGGLTGFTGASNTGLGVGTADSITSGTAITAAGVNAGTAVTSGTDGVYIGSNAGAAVATANDNVAVGSSALLANTGGGNTSVGRRALSGTGSGGNHTAVGLDALPANLGSSTGDTAVGQGSLALCTGSDTTGVGTGAGATHVSGTGGTYIGYHADTNAASSSNRISIGRNSSVTADNACNIGDANVTAIYMAGTKLLGVRSTGWTAPTATQSKAGFANGASSTEVEQTLSAVVAALIAHGLLGS